MIKTVTLNRKSIHTFSYIVIFLLCMPLLALAREDKNMIIRLEGNWKFHITDNFDWANPDFDDSDWATIKVPSAWQDQGFNGYSGYAWYRTSFNYSKELKNKDLYLNLGYIGDVDQVFLNGHLIGFSGAFPPRFSPAVDAKRRYPIPENYLNTSGKNVICVRVYNYLMSGGILSGEIGISYNSVKPDVSLSGLWLFRTGDNKRWKEQDYKDDKAWKKIVVPSNWENQGYLDYNGYAWYRKHFTLSEDFLKEKLILVIGNVYQTEEVYINGKLIGSSGKMPGTKDPSDDDTHRKCRVYSIPENLLSPKQNTIAIRVYNSEYRGGIAEGPVGLFKSSTFSKFSKELTGNGD